MEYKKDIDQKTMDEIVTFVSQIKTGELVITVHDSKIVQIEKIEKTVINIL